MPAHSEIVEALSLHNMFHHYGSADPFGVDPTKVLSGQFWIDTTDPAEPLLMLRNEDNDAWLPLGGGGGGGGSYDDEDAYNAIAAALIDSTTVSWNKNGVDNELEAIVSSEYFRDLMAQFVTAGNRIVKTHDDGGDTLTIAVATETRALEVGIDGGGVAITTGVKRGFMVPYGCTISRVYAFCDPSATIVVDIWKDTYANHPPTDADSITASAPVTITAGTKSLDSTLTGWTTALSARDILWFNVDSNNTATWVLIVIEVTL